MRNRPTGGVTAKSYRTLFDLGPIGDLSDGQLLERCGTDRAEVAELAFAALVERHEALVWRVCLGILRDRHQAEDAWQATFVVLIRRARSLWVRDSLGPWLHEVAARTALRHRAATRRRLDREARAAARLGPQASALAPPTIDDDLAAALHEELCRLPANLRAPLVLCDLAGTTHAEAARSLGWPIGTLKSRQARGRRTLRDRLARRGFVSLGVGPLIDGGSMVAIPSRTTRDLAATLARRGFVSLGASPPALHLAQETLHAMLWIKLRPVIAALAVGLASTGTGLYVSSAQEPAPPPALATAGPVRKPADDGAARLKLRAQEIATQRARIAFDQARLRRELADLVIVEHQEIVSPRELALLNHKFAAEQAKRRVTDLELNFIKRLLDEKKVAQKEMTLAQAKSQEADAMVLLAQADRNSAESELDRKLRDLRSRLQMALGEEALAKADWLREQAKEAALRPR